MKLRIQGNSIRYRLTRKDLEQFKNKGYVEETTDFGNRTFTYALNRVSDNTELYADFNDGLMMLHVPDEMADNWIGTDLVGMEYNQDIDGYKKIHLLIEKDFKCLGKEGQEDQSDNFENPNSVC